MKQNKTKNLDKLNSSQLWKVISGIVRINKVNIKKTPHNDCFLLDFCFYVS